MASFITGTSSCLVLSGITTMEMMETFAYQPHIVLDGVDEIVK